MAAPLGMGEEFSGEREVNAMLCMVQSEHGREEGRFPELIWWISDGRGGGRLPFCPRESQDCRGFASFELGITVFARASVAEGRRRLISVASKSFSVTAIRRLKNPVPINDLLRDAANSLGEAVER